MKLDKVEEKEDPVEWITSVSMLTEGWDVKNVFQIVPHEERAFNSKLLIAQVLGRGLRIPEEYKGEQPFPSQTFPSSGNAMLIHLKVFCFGISDNFASLKSSNYGNILVGNSSVHYLANFK